MRATPFSIPTSDGLSQLRGVIEKPGESASDQPILLIVPGGWFMERDGYMGDSGTEADLMYRRLAHRVVRSGYPVARYDNRGVYGNELSAGFVGEEDSLESTAAYLKACVNDKERLLVTADSGMHDLVSVYRHIGQRHKKVAVFAHSEGGLHVAKAISRRLVNPAGLVLVGAIADSPAGILRWQTVQRYVEELFRWDDDGDGILDEKDILKAYGDGCILAETEITKEVLGVPESGWDRENLTDFFLRKYEEMKADALATDPDEAYPRSDGALDFVAASYSWWQQWFTDEETLVSRLCDYRGRVHFHLGGLDSQASGARELSIIDRSGLSNSWHLVLHESRGHALRTGERNRGPMDDEAEDLLVSDVLAIMHED
jgi:pimeloyl-ACP methyl ester carboxylesterase